MYFQHYGVLEWLAPDEYFAGPWKFLCMAEGDDGEKYDIVIMGDYPCELRFTNI